MNVDEWDLLISYQCLLVDAYSGYGFSLDNEFDAKGIYEECLSALLASFESQYAAIMLKVNSKHTIDLRWEYIDRPNNLMIEAFARTKGKLNSSLVHSLFSGRIPLPFASSSLRGSDPVKLFIPFCGSSFELSGVLSALVCEYVDQRFDVRVSDICPSEVLASEIIYASSSEADPRLVESKHRLNVIFSREDASVDSGLHCDVIIGFHPQIANPLTNDRIMWRKIITSCIARSRIAMFFTLSIEEARLVQLRAQQLGREMRITEIAESLPMPRELITRARSARIGRTLSVPRHRYYGFLVEPC
jgi:hypothetical protein